MERVVLMAVWATTAFLASAGLFIFPVAGGALPWYAAGMLGGALLGAALAAVWPEPEPRPEAGNPDGAAGPQQPSAGHAATGDGRDPLPRRNGQISAVARLITLLACLSLAGGLVSAAATATQSSAAAPPADTSVWAESPKESELRQAEEHKVLVEYRSLATQAAGGLLETIASLAKSPQGVSDAVARRITELSGAVKDITGSLKDVTGAVVDIASLFKKGGASSDSSSSSEIDVSVENNVPPAKVTVVQGDDDTECRSHQNWRR